MKTDSVEQLGGEGACARVQPPGLGEKQAAIGWDRLLAAKDVMQGVRTFGMAASCQATVS
jgi:hypothetical protein